VLTEDVASPSLKKEIPRKEGGRDCLVAGKARHNKQEKEPWIN